MVNLILKSNLEFVSLDNSWCEKVSLDWNLFGGKFYSNDILVKVIFVPDLPFPSSQNYMFKKIDCKTYDFGIIFIEKIMLLEEDL